MAFLECVVLPLRADGTSAFPGEGWLRDVGALHLPLHLCCPFVGPVVEGEEGGD